MSKVALFVRHKAKPGKRKEIQKIWESYVKPRVLENPSHELYYFCFDSKDRDSVNVFQVFSNEDAMNAFMAGSWYPEYLNKISEVIAEPPIIAAADPIWKKES